MLQQLETKHQPVGQFEDTRFEKIHNVTYKSSLEASNLVAQEIANLIVSNKDQIIKKIPLYASEKINIVSGSDSITGFGEPKLEY